MGNLYDLVIKNGLVLDGLGNQPYKASIAIREGKIATINPNINEDTKKTIDAKGLAIAPGFIDIHTHSDNSFLIDNRSESKVFQGVTTEAVGQCGRSYFPYIKREKERVLAYIGGKSGGLDRDYYTSQSVVDFIKKARKNKKKMSINWMPFIGHNTLRASVMGLEGRRATKGEIKKMADLLEQEMESGAWGLSLGLGYAPGVFSNIEELAELGRVVAKYGGLITSHMRNQGEKIYEALEEMFEIYRRTGARIHIAHLKLSGKKQWGKGEELLNYIKKAQEEGIEVSCDIYPYEAASSGITNTLPKWMLDGGNRRAAERFKTGERKRIMRELERKFQDKSLGDRIYIVSTYGQFPLADDKTLSQLAKELGLSLAEALEKVVVETKGRCRQISFAMDENDMLKMIGERDIAIGSDGSGLPLDPKANRGKPHPRSFGTFPRFLRLAREKRMMPLEDAVYKMTGLPASLLGLKDRGVLREGYVADITIFNPATVTDTATYQDPFQKPVGIEYVIVSGKILVNKGQQTKNRLGQFLLK